MNHLWCKLCGKNLVKGQKARTFVCPDGHFETKVDPLDADILAGAEKMPTKPKKIHHNKYAHLARKK